MVRPTRDDIHSYMTITGASESLTIQRLETLNFCKFYKEHGGNLTQAVNAHFRDVEMSIVDPSLDTRPDYNVVEGNNQVRDEPRPGGLPSLLSAARAFRPSLLLDPNYRRNIFRQISASGFSPQTSQAGEVTRFPAHSTWENHQIRPPGLGDVGDGYARYPSSHGSQIYGVPHRNLESPLYNNDAEEEMIRAAIEASNKDFQEGHNNTGSNLNNDPSSVLLPTEVIQQENEDIARAISLSLEMEEKERELREQIAKLMPHPHEHHDTCETDANESSRSKHRSSSVQYGREDTKEKQPMDISSHHRHDSQSVEAPNPEEWGGIPSEELQEAIMLENALFNGMSVESASYNDLPGIHMESQFPDNRIISEEEPEKSSTANKAQLSIEPLLENEDAITLLVRMPDSSRHGRRFLKSDKLKYLFDFIDATGLVEPNSYRLVRPYPRRAFSLREGALTFEELSLTNKQEALFLELM